MKRICLCGLLLLVSGLSCSDHDMFLPVGGPVTRPGDGTRALTPVVTNLQNAYTFSVRSDGQSTSYEYSLIFDSDSVSSATIVSAYSGGSCSVSVLDVRGTAVLADSLFSDTTFANSIIVGKVPARIVIRLREFNGIVSVNLMRTDLGVGAQIFGLWKWEYGYAGFGPTYYSPQNTGIHILLAFGRDSTLSVYKQDSLVYRDSFSVVPPTSWSGGDPVLVTPYPYLPWERPWMGLHHECALWMQSPDSIVLSPKCADCGSFTYSRMKFETTPDIFSVRNTRWQILSFDTSVGHSVILDLRDTILLNFDDSRLCHGESHGLCGNYFFGVYVWGGGNYLRFDSLGTTEMACAQSDYEKCFRRLFIVTKFDVQDTLLYLYYGADDQRLVLRKSR